MLIMSNIYIKNLAVVPYAKFETLFYQTLSDELEASSQLKSDILSARTVNNLLDNKLNCDNLKIKNDLSLSEEELHNWLTRLAEKLRSADILNVFHQSISGYDDISLKDILSVLSSNYGEILLEKGAKVILNTAFGFKSVNIKNAIENRAVENVSGSYTSKLLILDKEYFHYENSKTIYSSFTEYRKEFLFQYFRILHSYEDKLNKERFNTLFKDFV